MDETSEEKAKEVKEQDLALPLVEEKTKPPSPKASSRPTTPSNLINTVRSSDDGKNEVNEKKNDVEVIDLEQEKKESKIGTVNTTGAKEIPNENDEIKKEIPSEIKETTPENQAKESREEVTQVVTAQKIKAVEFKQPSSSIFSFAPPPLQVPSTPLINDRRSDMALVSSTPLVESSTQDTGASKNQSKGSHVVPEEALINKKQAQMAEAFQVEKTYVVPTDIPEIGWKDCYTLGPSLTYLTLCMRRNISEQHLYFYNEKHASMPVIQAVDWSTLPPRKSKSTVENNQENDEGEEADHNKRDNNNKESPTVNAHVKKEKEEKKSENNEDEDTTEEENKSEQEEDKDDEDKQNHSASEESQDYDRNFKDLEAGDPQLKQNLDVEEESGRVLPQQSMRLMEVTGPQCYLLAHLGLAFNTSTQELMIKRIKKKPKYIEPRPKRRKQPSPLLHAGSVAASTIRRGSQHLLHRISQVHAQAHKGRKAGSSSDLPTTKVLSATTETMRKYSFVPKATAKKSKVKKSMKPMVVDSGVKGIGDVGAIALFQALRVNKTLVSLHLEHAFIGDVSMCALAAALNVNMTLTKLSLRHNIITSMGLAALCEALEDIPDSLLMDLDLSYNKIKDQGAFHLAKALEENETITRLDVSWNQISSKGLNKILLSLRENFVLRRLDIYGKDFYFEQDESFHFVDNMESSSSEMILNNLKMLSQEATSLSELGLTSVQSRVFIEKVKTTRRLNLQKTKQKEIDILIVAGLIPFNSKIIEIDLSSNTAIGKWGILQVLKEIKKCPTLQFLKINETGLYEEASEQIAEEIASNETIKKIQVHTQEILVQQVRGIHEPIIDHLFLKADPVKEFLDGWVFCKCLALNRKTLWLNENIGIDLTKKGISLNGIFLEKFEVVFLGVKIYTHRSIQWIKLNHCQIDPYGAISLADAIRNHSTLTQIEMEKNFIGEEGGKAMTECILYNQSLRHINLSWNQIGNKGFIEMHQALKINKSLRILDLRGNNLSLAGIEAIAQGLSKNFALEELNLRWNTICPKGAIALANALKKNRSLKKLDIEHHCMKAQGAFAMAEMLSINKTLEYLNMKGDDIIPIDHPANSAIATKAAAAALLAGSTGAVKAKSNNERHGNGGGIGSEAGLAITKALSESKKSLKVFSMGQNQIGREGLNGFYAVLKYATRLESLDLTRSDLDGSTSARLFEALASNKTLLTLVIPSNRISNEGMMACVKALEVNTTLRDLDVGQNHITEEPLALLVKKLKDKAWPQTGLKWIQIAGNSFTKQTKISFQQLAPSIIVDTEEEFHRVPEK